MKTYTKTVRIGEWLGPVDPEYDFSQHSWTGRSGGVNPDAVKAGKEKILEIASDPDGWRYSPSGFSSFPVVNVGMYDGWPYWSPTPAIGYIGPMKTVEIAFFYSLNRHNIFKSAEES